MAFYQDSLAWNVEVWLWRYTKFYANFFQFHIILSTVTEILIWESKINNISLGLYCHNSKSGEVQATFLWETLNFGGRKGKRTADSEFNLPPVGPLGRTLLETQLAGTTSSFAQCSSLMQAPSPRKHTDSKQKAFPSLQSKGEWNFNIRTHRQIIPIRKSRALLSNRTERWCEICNFVIKFISESSSKTAPHSFILKCWVIKDNSILGYFCIKLAWLTANFL